MKNGNVYNAWHIHNNIDFAKVPPVINIIAYMDIIGRMKFSKTKKNKKNNYRKWLKV